MTAPDYYTTTEADAGRYERAHAERPEPDRPDLADVLPAYNCRACGDNGCRVCR